MADGQQEQQEQQEQESLEMHRQLTQFASALTSFSSSSSTFRILTSISSSKSSSSPLTPSTLYVLDSSFNPPTIAHLRIATSALTQDTHGGPLATRRLLLLLATQNADKPAKPASFEQRLTLMTIFAHDLLRSLSSSPPPAAATAAPHSTPTSNPEALPTIDIALTTHPFFTSKALSISQSGAYPSEITQIHLTGYDTLIRILDPKYYPPTHTLAPLEPFLSKHRLRVTYRTGDGWGEREEQNEYLAALGRGEREAEGGRREWARRIELVDGKGEDEEVVSSTRVREAARTGNEELLRRFVSRGVADWVLKERLYTDDND